MKKIAFILICVMMLGSAGYNAKADDVWSKIALYIPNRFMDALDIVTLSVGAGPVVRADIYATRAFAFGAGVGAEVMAVKGCNRQYGVCREAGYNMSFAMFNSVSLTRDGQSRLVVQFVIDAMESLGFTRSEARLAVTRVVEDRPSLPESPEELLREALDKIRRS